MPKEGCPLPDSCFILAYRSLVVEQGDRGTMNYIDSVICAGCLAMQAQNKAIVDGIAAKHAQYLVEHPQKAANNSLSDVKET